MDDILYNKDMYDLVENGDTKLVKVANEDYKSLTRRLSV